MAMARGEKMTDKTDMPDVVYAYKLPVDSGAIQYGWEPVNKVGTIPYIRIHVADQLAAALEYFNPLLEVSQEGFAARVKALAAYNRAKETRG